MFRDVTGTLYRFGGDVWANALIRITLMTMPATLPAELYPPMVQETRTNADGTIPAGAIKLGTPATGSWKYSIQVEDGIIVEFYLEREDGSALTIDEIYALAGFVSETGTPQAAFWLAVYNSAQEAAAFDLLTADGAGGATFLAGGRGDWLQRRGLVAAGELTIPDNYQLLAADSYTVDGILIVEDGGQLVILST